MEGLITLIAIISMIMLAILGKSEDAFWWIIDIVLLLMILALPLGIFQAIKAIKKIRTEKYW